MEAMTWALTRAQRTLARGGQVLWVMEDVKRGFNNVMGQELLDVVASSCKKGWCRGQKNSSDHGSLSSGTGKCVGAGQPSLLSR